MTSQPLSALTPAQARVHQLVAAQPGLTIMQAAKLLGCTHATATYHLNLLLQRGYLQCQRDGREVRHFTAGARDGQAYLQALCRDPRRSALAQHVASLGMPATVNEVARALQVPFGFAKRTLAQLAAEDLVRIERRRIWYMVMPTQRLKAALAPAPAASAQQAPPAPPALLLTA